MELLLDGGHFFEGARWHDWHFYVSDLYAGQVLRVGLDGSVQVVVTLDDQPSGLGWLPDGTMLVIGMKQRRLWACAPGQGPRLHADITALTGGFANDMIVDREGRAFVSNLGFDLFTAVSVGEPLQFPNGMVISNDGRTLIIAETFGGRLSAYDIAADGTLSGKRCWAQLGREPSWASVHDLLDTDFAPDGCAIDAEDHVWVADAIGARVARVRDGVGVVRQFAAPPGLGLYSCALGGADRRTLLICTAPDFSDVHRKAAREARLYTVRLDQAV